MQQTSFVACPTAGYQANNNFVRINNESSVKWSSLLNWKQILEFMDKLWANREFVFGIQSKRMRLRHHSATRSVGHTKRKLICSALSGPGVWQWSESKLGDTCHLAKHSEKPSTRNRTYFSTSFVVYRFLCPIFSVLFRLSAPTLRETFPTSNENGRSDVRRLQSACRGRS